MTRKQALLGSIIISALLTITPIAMATNPPSAFTFTSVGGKDTVNITDNDDVFTATVNATYGSGSANYSVFANGDNFTMHIFGLNSSFTTGFGNQTAHFLGSGNGTNDRFFVASGNHSQTFTFLTGTHASLSYNGTQSQAFAGRNVTFIAGSHSSVALKADSVNATSVYIITVGSNSSVSVQATNATNIYTITM